MHKMVATVPHVTQPDLEHVHIYHDIVKAIHPLNIPKLEELGATVEIDAQKVSVYVDSFNTGGISPNARSYEHRPVGISHRSHIRTSGVYQQCPSGNTMYLVKGTKVFDDGVQEKGKFKWNGHSDSVLVYGVISFKWPAATT